MIDCPRTRCMHLPERRGSLRRLRRTPSLPLLYDQTTNAAASATTKACELRLTSRRCGNEMSLNYPKVLSSPSCNILTSIEHLIGRDSSPDDEPHVRLREGASGRTVGMRLSLSRVDILTSRFRYREDILSQIC